MDRKTNRFSVTSKSLSTWRGHTGIYCFDLVGCMASASDFD